MRRVVFDQSSPIHPISETWGVSLILPLLITTTTRRSLLLTEWGWSIKPLPNMIWCTVGKAMDKFALERSQGKSDFPKGHNPGGRSDYPRDLPRANLPDNASGFSTVNQTSVFKNRRGFKLSLWTEF